MKIVYTRETGEGMDRVGTRLEAAAARYDFGVLGMIDLKEKMNSKGVEFEQGCRVYEVCNPHQARKALKKNMTISTVLPCRISVYEEDGMTVISTILPTVLLNAFHETALWPVAHQVEKAIIAMIDDVVSPAPARKVHG